MELDRVRRRACQLATILIALNERYAAAKRERCPCSLMASLDRAVRRAIGAYRKLGLAAGENLVRMPSARAAAAVGSPFGDLYPANIVAGDDDIDLQDSDDSDARDNVDDRFGLMRQVRERCCRQAQIVSEAMHRATIYQGERLMLSKRRSERHG
jgi:hypothetical protein